MTETQILKRALESKRPCYLVRIDDDWKLVSDGEFSTLKRSIPQIVYDEIPPTDYELAKSELDIGSVGEFLDGRTELAEMHYEDQIDYAKKAYDNIMATRSLC